MVADWCALPSWPLQEWVEIVDSPSFPGLTTQYRLQQMSAIVRGLPSAPFTTEEKDKGTTKVHSWEWRTDGPGSLVRAKEQQDDEEDGRPSMARFTRAP